MKDTRGQNDWYRRLFDESLTEIHVWQLVRDDEGRIKTWKLVDANPAALRSWGTSLSQALGKTAGELFPNSNPTELFLPVVETIFAEQRALAWEEYFPDTGQHLHMVSIPMGEFFISAGFDIGDLRRSEAELREANLKRREAIHAGRVGLWDWDLRTNKVSYSGEWKAQIGYTVDEIGDDFDEWQSRVHPDDLARTLESVQQAIATRRQEHQAEFRFRHKDGSYRWFLAHASIVHDEAGEPVRMLGSHVDITARRNAEEERTRVITMARDLICIADINTATFLEVNPAFERILGHSEETLLSRPFLDFTHPDDVEPTRRVVEDQLRRGETILSFVNRYRCADGSYRWLDWNSSPDPAKGRTYAIARDVTERRKQTDHLRAQNQALEAAYRQLQATEQRVRQLETRSRALVEHSPVCHKIVDLDFKLQYMNANGFRMLKLEETDERYGQPYPFDFFPEATREVLTDSLRKVVETRHILTFDSEACDVEGQAIWLHHHIIPVFKEDGALDYVTVVSADITERKQQELELRRFEWLDEREQLEPEPVPDTDLTYPGDLTALNTRRVIADAVDTEELADMARDLMDLLGTSLVVFEANGDQALAVFDSAWCRSMNEASFALCQTDDTREALDCGAWLCHESCWRDSARAAIRSGSPTDTECAGGIQVYAVPIRAGDEVIGAINIGYGGPPTDETSLRALAERFERPLDELRGTAWRCKPRPRFIVDIARRRCRSIARMIGNSVQKGRLEAQLAQADRLSSMGTLAAGVAHEINNPLTYTLYNLKTVVEELPAVFSEHERLLASSSSSPPAAEREQAFEARERELADLLRRAREALDGAQRIRSIARTLGTFSRVDDEAGEGPVDIRRAVEHARRMAGNEIRYRAKMQLELSPTSPVRGSEGKLAQVFLNLLLNAAHAIDEGDVDGNAICVRTREDGDAVLAEVEDTGRGIPREHLERLFEPFFTTKPIGEGSGLGLAISRKIITDMGGEITCESREGRGTTFRIRLPALRVEGPRRDAESASTPAATRAGGRILVVDDELAIRSLFTHMLGRDDREVVTAGSGAEGRAVLERDQRFDLILLDLMMPRVSGMELHQWLAEHHPALAKKVIFVTGGAFTPAARSYLAGIDNVRLNKPFELTEFKRVVDEAIDAGGRVPG